MSSERRFLVVGAESWSWAIDVASVIKIRPESEWSDPLLDVVGLCGLRSSNEDLEDERQVQAKRAARRSRAEAHSGSEAEASWQERHRVILARGALSTIIPLAVTGPLSVIEVDGAKVLPLPTDVLGIETSIIRDVVFVDPTPILIVDVGALSAHLRALEEA